MLICSSLELPVLICVTEQAAELYEDLLNTDVLKVPVSDESRLKSWPHLESGPEIVVTGIEKHITTADIVLSSCGWAGINLRRGETAVFKAWTPRGQGIYLRQPALLKQGIKLKGSRIRNSLAYKVGKAFVKH